MQGKLCQLYNKFEILVLREENQDFIEYAMLVAVIALATTAGMYRMAGAFNVKRPRPRRSPSIRAMGDRRRKPLSSTCARMA